MKSIIILSALTSAVWAQSSSNSSTSNPLIPSGISAQCTSFLTTLDSDSNLSSCTKSLTSATADFTPGSNSSSSSTTLSSALNSLCSTALSACSTPYFQTQLANFYSNCPEELTTQPNVDVKRLYDVLYAIVPATEAVCAKDVSGDYCVTQLSPASASSSSSSASPSVSVGSNLAASVASPSLASVLAYLSEPLAGAAALKRDSTQSPALVPNVTTWAESNILFMLLQATSPKSILCSSCASTVITDYINFETACPYAPGMGNSVLFSGQSAIYNAMQQQCGSAFLSGALKAAGGLTSDLLGSGAGRSLAVDSAATIGLSLAVVAFTFVAFL